MIDAHVLVGALIAPGSPFEELRDAADRVRFLITDEVFREALCALLDGTSLTAAIPALGQVSLRAAILRMGGDLVHPDTSGVDVEACADPEENRSLIEALSLGCTVLVTQSGELLELEDSADWKAFMEENGLSLRILDVRRFLESLEATGDDVS